MRTRPLVQDKAGLSMAAISIHFMPSSFRLRTLVADTWHSTCANPSLLVFGLLISILALYINSLLFLQIDFQKGSSGKDVFSILTGPILFLTLLALLTQIIASSQIFVFAASDYLRRPNLLTLRSRFIAALIYVGGEIASILPITVTLYLLFIPSLLHLEPTGLFSTYFTILALTIIIVIVFLVMTIKRLAFGYLTLSPLHFRSSVYLALKILLRYRSVSILSFFFLITLISLFTILENLVMLQSVFLRQYLPNIAPEVLIYTVLLLIHSFVSVFIEVFWLNFFLTLTRKNQKNSLPLPLPNKQLEDVPLMPS